MKKFVLLLISLLLAVYTSGGIEIQSIKTDNPPVIDGILDDDVWNKAPAYSDFETFQPDFNKTPSELTIARTAYDDEYLYFAIEAHDSEPGKIKASVTKWDNLYQDDWVGVGLDALNDQQSAYGFIVNAYGSQGDLMLDPQGDGDPSEDFIWDAAGSNNETGFNVEMRIPLQSIRFNAGHEVVMGLFFVRQLSRYSEMVIFPPIYPDKGSLLSQIGIIIFKDLKYHRTYEILPSFTQTSNREAQGGKLQRLKDESGSDIGITAKVGLTPTLTLDLTVNPDFSQIESDASQVDVNLRYPNFYPEKRPFFLEGIKNFDIAGIGNGSGISHVVHTRTIADPSFGIKLSGKLGSDNALAAIIVRDESPIYEEDAKKPADFGILRYKRLLHEESYIGGIFTSREHEGGFNRVVGMDGLWRLSGTMKIDGNTFYGVSKDPESGKVTNAHNVDISWSYGDRKYFTRVGIHDISKNFRLDTGYIPRDGTTTLTLSGRRSFYLKSKILNKIDAGYWGYMQRDKYFDMNDGQHNFYLQFLMPRSTYIELNYANGSEVYEDKLFDRSGIEIELTSQIFKSLFFDLEIGTKGSPWYDDPDNPFQGDITYQTAFINFQPTENLSSEVIGVREIFTSRDDGLDLYDYNICRIKTTYQINKYLFIRGILDYTYVKYPDYAVKYPEEEETDDEKRLTSEFLIGFTYIPGTVVYFGYGTRHENLTYDGEDYIPSNSFTEMKSGLFFKASYNWRI